MSNHRDNLKPGKLIADWGLLKPGDIFTVTGGGSYYSKTYEPLSDEYYGKEFKVVNLKEDGIVSINVDDKYFAFVYMGPDEPSPVMPNISRTAHELVFTEGVV